MKVEGVDATVSDTARLSVIIPTCTRKTSLSSGLFQRRRALIEKCVQSVLNQSDPIGTEIIVAEDGDFRGIADHIKSCFPNEFASGKLQAISMGLEW